nr:ribonuclease H-like domain-containing protein [Tanacetum cinerariifolium]
MDSPSRAFLILVPTILVPWLSSLPYKIKKGLGYESYHAVPPPPTRLFLPPKLDLSNSGLEEFQQPEFKGYGPKTSKSVSEDIPNELKEYPNASLVKDSVSDNKHCSVYSHVVVEKKTDVPTIAKVKVVRTKQQEKPVRKLVKYAEMYRPRTVNTARPRAINTARLRAINTARPNLAVINAVRGHPQKVQEDQGYVKSGCSRHMTENMSYLFEYKEFNRGYVTFGGRANGGRIIGKGTLKTSKLDFKDVYFVKELKFNLVSVSQMCDKKNSVLFTNTGCFVPSPNFKLADDSHVLLKVHRKNNMYSVDMKNFIPKESLTCLVAKATLDESMLWHRRLGHINFKNINNLVRDKLVRATKNETIGILKKFITEIENLIDSKVKGISSKPHNKTPYELFREDEGYFVEYSMNSKAFRVYNMRVEENLHIEFLENKPIIADTGPEWLFAEENLHIEFLENKPIIADTGPEWLFAGTNSNDFACTKDIIGACQSNMETGSTQDYIFMPLWKDGSQLFDYSLKLSDDAGSPYSGDDGKKHDGVSDKENRALNELNYAFENLNTEYLDDPKMPGLETIATYDDYEEEAEFTNLEPSIHVSPTPTTRTHKNHPLKQVIGSLNTPVQTRSKLKPTNEQGFISVLYEGKTHKDLNRCLFVCFLSQIEPTRVAKALSNPA